METKFQVPIVILVIVGILCVCVLPIFSFMSSANNTAVKLDETVNQQWSGIDAQLQRRYDLILSLVNVVENQAKFEKELQTKVAEMRSNVNSGDIEQTMLSINAVTEAYPQITTNASYTQLMTELSITENLIIEQRKTYNSSAKEYRTYVRTFPNNILLNIMGYQESQHEYLEFETPTYNPELFDNE